MFILPARDKLNRDPVLKTALAARLHAREVQGGRLKICWAKVRLGSNPSAGKTFCPKSRFLTARRGVLNDQTNRNSQEALIPPRFVAPSSAAPRIPPGYWRNWKRASLARTRYWDRNPDTPVAFFFEFQKSLTYVVHSRAFAFGDLFILGDPMSGPDGW